MNSVICSECGAIRPVEITQQTVRTPCPNCGGTALTISASINERLYAVDRATAELIPGKQDRDWEQRWRIVQDDLQQLLQPKTGICSSDTIHASAHHLFSFYIAAYHLKDILKEAAPQLGIEASEVEAAITNDPRLSLLADLANSDKHYRLKNRPRSGSVPIIDNLSGIDTQEGEGWQLSVQIRHGAAVLDGLAIAQDAINAWNEKLQLWGLI